MSPAQAALSFRLETMLGRLRQAEEALKTVQQEDPPHPGRKRLYELAGASLLQRVSHEIEELETRLGQAGAGDVSSVAWSAASPVSSKRLLNDSLLYLQAAQSRGNGSDGDLCAIVDLLFAEVANEIPHLAWKSYSVFSADDSYDRISDVIRIRYPVSGVWDLPVCVHEFGHYVSDKLLTRAGDGTTSQSIKTYVAGEAQNHVKQRSKPDGRDWAIWLEEVFADVFASIVLGPAFGYASVVLRFDPGSASEERDGKHPADAKRVYVIRTTLETLNARSELDGKLAPSITQIRRYWESACASAGRRPEPDEQSFLFGLVDRFVTDIMAAAPNVGFRRWKPLELQSYLFGFTESLPNGTKITELLNAAWLCRVQKPLSAGTVNKNFVKFCRQRM